MGTRTSLIVATVMSALAFTPGARGPVLARQQMPQFRGVTDIVAIDFLALRGDGQPVTDLTARDITVKVDGRARELRSFQFVKVSTTSRETAAASALPPPFAANDGAVPGRTIILVFDHEQVRASEGKAALDAAGRFLDRLTPADRVGLVTLPAGRVEVDLTTNHGRVRKALASVVGRAQRTAGISNISLNEALTVLAEVIDPDKTFTKELVDRECRFAPEDSFCRTRVVQDALQIAREAQRGTRASLVALKGFFDGLAAVEGPKAIVYMSGSLVSFQETLKDLEDVARSAARARAQMFVVQPHDTMADVTQRDQPPSAGLDSQQRLAGLQDLAGVTGGAFFRLAGTGDLAFRRIADEMSAHYLIGFEPRPGEADGKPHRLEITTSKPGVSIRVRPMFVLDDPTRTPPPMALETLLRDFATHRDLPLRAAAYSFRDLDPKHVKIVVAAEPADPGVTLVSAAFALIDAQGARAAEWNEGGAGVVSRPLLTSAAVPPGEYRLRVVAVDTAGRRGAVDYEFTAGLTGTPPITFATLMAGSMEQGNFRPRLVLGPEHREVVAYAEFYADLPSGTALTATVDVLTRPDGPPVVRGVGDVRASPQVTRYVVTGAVPTGLAPPGDYLLRVTVFVNDRPSGTTVRTFRKKS